MKLPGEPPAQRPQQRRGRRTLRLLAAAGWVCAFCHAQPSQAQNATQAKAPPESRITSQMHEAIASAQHGDEQHALAVVSALLQQHPAFAPALKLQGMLLEDTGHNAEALVAYRRALALAPNDPDMLLKAGTLELVNGHVEEAIALLQRRVRVVSEDEDGNYYLAQAFHLQGNNDLALAAIRKALHAAPQDAPVLQKYGELLCSSGQNEQAVEWLKKAEQIDPSLSRINFDLAVASYNSMDLNAAAAYAGHAAQAEPNNLANLVLLASVQMKLAQWQQARANLGKVLAVSNDDATSMLELGECDLELKDDRAAVDSLQRALQLDPTQVRAHYLLARAYAALGDTSEAQHEAALHREMMQHISFAMPAAEARLQNAITDQARHLLTEGHEAQALQLFQSTDKGPYVTRGSAWMAVGAIYLSLGDTQAAERSFRRSLELDPGTHGLHA